MPAIGLATRLYAGRVSLEGEIAGFSTGSLGSALGGGRIRAPSRLRPAGRDGRVPAPFRSTARTGLDQVKLKLGGWQFGLELSL